MIFSLSRTIQWLREAAQLRAVYGTPVGRGERARGFSEWLSSSALAEIVDGERRQHEGEPRCFGRSRT